MRRIALFAVGFGLLAPLLAAAPAHAQATRTWVSGVGDDVNPCSRTAPCKTFAGAISKTAAGGIINCLDPGGFGTLTITKSLEIDCLNTKAGMLAANTNGVNVNGAGITVVLRGLSIEGIGTGLVGVNVLQGAAVHIEHCLIRGFRAGNAAGVRVATTAGNPEVTITDSHITDNGAAAAGGGIVGATTGASFAFITLNNVRLVNNFQGMANNANSRMRVSNSLIASNTIGIQTDVGGAVSLANSDLNFNATAISGATTSFGNNRIVGNLADGTAPTAAGAPSTDLGQK
jgi:hypothetical protein